ncbi:MAG: UDP-N-acetylmuramoyl-L-alanyl-D-glutamate--2,6-diaminopimelate ligase [Phycisphaeraceae bacterium]
MQLKTLIKDLPITLRRGNGECDIVGLTDDSRAVTKDSLFIARPGADGDPMRFVPNAIQTGAIAVLLPHDVDDAAIDELPGDLAILTTKPNTVVDQRLCGKLAERFYDNPSRKLKLLGVTGTNGKTTTVTIAKHLLESAGHKTGLIGTVELDTGSPTGPTPATLTTPGAIQLTQLLAEMVANGCTCCVMEVSSHALHQGRADHVRFAAAAFTNLTQDHLDYHGDMHAYADAKAILFESLDKDAFAVLNGDDTWSTRMALGCCAAITFSAVLHEPEEESPEQLARRRCCAFPIEMTAATSTVEFAGPFARFKATLPLPGMHNLSNALQAMALARLAMDVQPKQLRTALESCPPVPGRLEAVGPNWPQPPAPQSNLPTVLVDYAHTPDALNNVGSTMRQLTKGKLITVFGCGGDRDRAKRPLMAKAAQQYADVVVLTSDNPRTEDPQQILDDAAKGFANTQHPTPKTQTIPDRAEAIRFAINLATHNDTVLIAGKGHEDYQIIGTEKHHFDDREQAAAALGDKLNQSAI